MSKQELQKQTPEAPERLGRVNTALFYLDQQVSQMEAVEAAALADVAARDSVATLANLSTQTFVGMPEAENVRAA